MTFLKPARAEGDRKYFRPREHLERLLAFRVNSVQENVRTNFGEANVVYADVTVIDGPDAGSVYPNAEIEAEVLYRSLAPNVGEVVLGRLIQPNKAFLLEDATAEDEALAETVLAKAA